MTNCYLAVDIGASSGRVIAVSYIDNHIYENEMHRFSNEMISWKNYKTWDIDALFEHILYGIKTAVNNGWKPQSIGIDTWAVDYVLLDDKDERIMPPIAYRDARTSTVIGELHEIVSFEEIYSTTGIQFQPFNTIYQIYAHRKQESEAWKKVSSILLLPDYLHFCLTGKKAAEYTNATTTQLVDAKSREWSPTVLKLLNFPDSIFPEILAPGSSLGQVKKEFLPGTLSKLDVILPPTHDTASAVAGAPLTENSLFISSGTWSLMGAELEEPSLTPASLERNFTNEGGYEGRIRFLKNIMGLWMIQEIKREYSNAYSFTDLVHLAKEASFDEIIDVNDPRFLHPESMRKTLQTVCRETGNKPDGPGEEARCVFRSLASSYAAAASELEKLTENEYKSIHLFGGGSQNEWLNQLTADFSGKTVIAGPVEATALGNAVVQMIAQKQFFNLTEARDTIRKSYNLKWYEPKEGLFGYNNEPAF
ncbi:rhamnulokinase [Alkalicoccus halolimnae]|uniref:Rhamnulokinase n=1 Tax=Alkalicoccus halolimnae TaxID=1667239 RepID=A0A5C7FJ34_9BACI|nr:rhamnulokinase [Alkalicoccus halolimnae]TXF86159.1 rhamnulokinase [Alkalicoccus halolimnae]